MNCSHGILSIAQRCIVEVDIRTTPFFLTIFSHKWPITTLFFSSSKYPFSVLDSSYSCALFGYRKFKRVGPENGISQLVARIPLLSMLISINATYFYIQLHFHFIHFRMHGQHCCWCCCCCCLKITFYCLEKKNIFRVKWLYTILIEAHYWGNIHFAYYLKNAMFFLVSNALHLFHFFQFKNYFETHLKGTK